METIGRITKEQMRKANRKGSRDAELELSVGWVATTKVHKSQKTYSRKGKHKNW